MANNKSFVFYAKNLEAKSYYDEKAGKRRYFVKGHIDSSDLDLVNDIVTKSCMYDIDKQFKSRNIKLDFDHETLRKAKDEDDFDAQLNLTKNPLGVAVNQNLDKKGNEIEFELNSNWKKLNKDNEVVMTFNEIWENIKSGMYDAFSIAYVPVRTSNKLIDGVKARLLEKVNMLNVALTGNPINPEATISSVMAKSLEYLKEKEDNNEVSNMEDKSQALDMVMQKVSMGKNLNKKEEKLLSSALDVANDDEAEKTMADNIMTKISQGIKLTRKEERILSALLDAEREEDNATEMAEKSNNNKNIKGGNMTENKSNEENNNVENQNVNNNTQAKGTENNKQNVGENKDNEAKSVDAKAFADLKSQVTELGEQIKGINKILEKAIPTGYGPEDKSKKQEKSEENNNDIEKEAKSIGNDTLNFI